MHGNGDIIVNIIENEKKGNCCRSYQQYQLEQEYFCVGKDGHSVTRPLICIYATLHQMAHGTGPSTLPFHLSGTFTHARLVNRKGSITVDCFPSAQAETTVPSLTYCPPCDGHSAEIRRKSKS